MASSLFIKIKSIPGSSTVKGFESTIECASFSWAGSVNVIPQSSAQGETIGHPNLGDLHVTKFPDKATPALFAAMTSAKRLTDDLELDINKVVNGSSQTFMTIKLQGVLVSSYNVGGGGGGEAPMETVSFNYTKVYLGFANENAGKLDAQVIKGWDGTTHAQM